MLRRNPTNRVAAGVCSGLGDYFRLDPVLFRVLFATAAFFGGAGILAYLLAWAAIPEAGTEHAPIDGFMAWVRRRRFPMLLVAVVAGLFLWAVAFSWWAPGPFFPIVAVVVLLIVIFARREMQASPPPPAAATAAGAPVDLTKGEAGESPAAGQPAWVHDARSWFDEAREASRIRRRRSLPIRIAMLATLAVTLTVLGIVDAVNGIQFQVYFWTTLGIVGTGLLVGMITRRTPLGMTVLLIPTVAGLLAFAGSDASLHDGVGQREWKPVGLPSSDYRLAFGQGILDLRSATPKANQTIHVTMGAGQVKIIAPKTMNLTVLANIHAGEIDVDGRGAIDNHFGRHFGGWDVQRVISPPAGATGDPVTVDVDLADGNISVEHR
jgi:phage shock protein PspC (stress-responsive transcriptional regulator)/FtsH-binding integral membrane protein